MAAEDLFKATQKGVTAPASGGFAIIPNDVTDLTFVTRGVYVGGGGDLDVVMDNGTAIVFQGVSGGTLLPISISRVKAQNTTATAILGLY